MQIRPLLAELRDRILEELDYAQEADNQRAFAAGYAGDEDFLVPRVVASAPKVDRVGMGGRHLAGQDHRVRHHRNNATAPAPC